MSYTCVHLLERFVHLVYIMFLVILAAKTNELKINPASLAAAKSGLKDSELKSLPERTEELPDESVPTKRKFI